MYAHITLRKLKKNNTYCDVCVHTITNASATKNAFMIHLWLFNLRVRKKDTRMHALTTFQYKLFMALMY